MIGPKPRRSTLARIGITLLNLLGPGLGLVRLESARDGIWLLAAPVLFLAASIGLFAIAPTPTFAGAAAYVVVLFISFLALLIVSIRLTWRRSIGFIGAQRPWWSRWYGIVLAFVVASIASNLAALACHRFYKPFYLPSESMAPTLDLNEKMLADMRGGRNPAIGEVIMFDISGKIFVKRVAALAGDKVGMKNGVPIVNGVAAIQHDEGNTSFVGYEGLVRARGLRERLPSEKGEHQIVDTGPSPIDDMMEQKVPPGYVFVLGDNRDRSADSRLPTVLDGIGMIPVSRIVGKPLFIHWSADRARIGQRISQ
ncbi:MAG: lepB 2 [Rhizorhabdus sp.]|nr:lepB 2 [Rhizorhabdus sp.]